MPHALDQWLYEMEGYGLRVERLCEELDQPIKVIRPWLEAAYNLGIEQGKLNAPSK